MHADVLAERQLISLALSGHPQAGERFVQLPQDVFTRGVHRAVAETLRDTFIRGARVHAPKIAVEAAERADTTHKAETISRFVADVGASAPPWDAFDFYAREVTHQRHLRELAAAGERLSALTSLDGLDLDTVTSRIRTLANDIDTAAGITAVEPPISLRALLDEPTEPYDWLVPGLLERMDRLVLTAFEGVGKSELLAQFAVTLAGGLHPFTGAPLGDAGGFRCLVVDCENPRRKVRRRYRRVHEAVNRLRERHGLGPVDWSQQLRLDPYPGGIDLSDARQAAHLEERIAVSAPDVVVAGPLYKMHATDTNEETAARALVGTLDRLRAQHGFTLICEAHSPHGEGANGKRKLRPVGSSLFLRWPEFGYGLQPFGDAAQEEHPSVVQLASWRGAREERLWPGLLRHGGPNDLPWVPADDPYFRKTLEQVT